MLGKKMRLLFAVTAMAPVSVSLAYVYGAKGANHWLSALALAFCFGLGLLAHVIITKSASDLPRLPVTLKKAKSADKEVVGFVVAYVLPLLFRGDPTVDLGAWAVGGMLLLFVLYSSHTLLVNPVLGVFGFHFYEVETEDGVSYLLITKRQINDILSVTTVVQLSEHGILESP